MFAEAYAKARSFTKPVVVSTRFWDGTVKCGVSAFVVLNEEGWIVTVAHLFDSLFLSQQHSEQIAKYNNQVEAIRQDQKLDTKRKKKKLRRLKANPRWITNHSFWWGRDDITIRDVKLLREADLAVGRLEPYDRAMVSAYPTIKNPSTNLDVGTSLCKLGYPLYEIRASFHEAENRFELPPGSLPIPLFPIEGIYTRNAIAGESQDTKYEIKFLETSSPGLRGQSGGPIFDVKGTVWAIQSRTSHFELGFSPKVAKNGREVEEHQFLNVGLGVHPEVMVAFLNDNDVKFRLTDY